MAACISSTFNFTCEIIFDMFSNFTCVIILDISSDFTCEIVFDMFRGDKINLWNQKTVQFVYVWVDYWFVILPTHSF